MIDDIKLSALAPFTRRHALITGLGAIGTAMVSRKAVAAEDEKLVMMAANLHKSIGSVDFYVAEQAGFFKAENLAVEVRYGANASQAAQVVASGNADFGRFSFDPGMIGYEKGLKLIGFYQFYRELIFYLGIPAGSSIKTLADLRGKKVGVSNMGSTAVGVLRSMLKGANIPANQVTLVPVGGAATALAARRSGGIDAYMLWNELYATLISAGEELRFVHSPDLGKIGGNAYFAHADSFDKKPQAYMRLSRAIAKASVFIRANYDAAAKIYLKINPDAGSPDTPADVAKISKELKFWAKDWAVEEGKQEYGQFNFDYLRAYAEELHSEGRLKAIPPIHEIFTNKVIDEANSFDIESVRKLAKNWT